MMKLQTPKEDDKPWIKDQGLITRKELERWAIRTARSCVETKQNGCSQPVSIHAYSVKVSTETIDHKRIKGVSFPVVQEVHESDNVDTESMLQFKTFNETIKRYGGKPEETFFFTCREGMSAFKQLLGLRTIKLVEAYTDPKRWNFALKLRDFIGKNEILKYISKIQTLVLKYHHIVSVATLDEFLEVTDKLVKKKKSGPPFKRYLRGAISVSTEQEITWKAVFDLLSKRDAEAERLLTNIQEWYSKMIPHIDEYFKLWTQSVKDYFSNPEDNKHLIPYMKVTAETGLVLGLRDSMDVKSVDVQGNYVTITGQEEAQRAIARALTAGASIIGSDELIDYVSEATHGLYVGSLERWIDVKYACAGLDVTKMDSLAGAITMRPSYITRILGNLGAIIALASGEFDTQALDSWIVYWISKYLNFLKYVRGILGDDIQLNASIEEVLTVIDARCEDLKLRFDVTKELLKPKQTYVMPKGYLVFNLGHSIFFDKALQPQEYFTAFKLISTKQSPEGPMSPSLPQDTYIDVRPLTVPTFTKARSWFPQYWSGKSLDELKDSFSNRTVTELLTSSVITTGSLFNLRR